MIRLKRMRIRLWSDSSALMRSKSPCNLERIIARCVLEMIWSGQLWEHTMVLVEQTQDEVPDGRKYVQTVPDGKYLCPDRPRRKLSMSRLSCVHVQTFVRSCPDFRAFDRLSCVHVQTFVRFLMFPDYVILNARRPPRAFIFGLDILASVWDLNLGSVQFSCICYLVQSSPTNFCRWFWTKRLLHLYSIVQLLWILEFVPETVYLSAYVMFDI